MNGIIVNADDYGMSPRISAAILKATQEGRINSTSVDLCNELTRDDAARILDAGILIGLHLNLGEGRPVGKDERLFPLLDELGCFKAAIFNFESKVEAATILSEFQSQLDRFHYYFERAPTHLDSHQHFAYLHPPAFEAILQLSRSTKIAIRSPKPFIQTQSLRSFCERVKTRYGITLPFAPDERAAVLKELFFLYRPNIRSDDLYLDFDPEKLKQMMSKAEMIVHF